MYKLGLVLGAVVVLASCANTGVTVDPIENSVSEEFITEVTNIVSDRGALLHFEATVYAQHMHKLDTQSSGTFGIPKYPENAKISHIYSNVFEIQGAFIFVNMLSSTQQDIYYNLTAFYQDNDSWEFGNVLLSDGFSPHPNVPR